MIRLSTGVAWICLLGGTGIWATAAFAGATSAPQIQLCAEVPDEAPEATMVEVAATSPATRRVENFYGTGNDCKAAVDVVSGQYAISAAVLNATCSPLHYDTSIECAVPAFGHFEIEREVGVPQRLDPADSVASIVPSISGYTRVTAVFTTR